jgi:hypothetical protein
MLVVAAWRDQSDKIKRVVFNLKAGVGKSSITANQMVIGTRK